MRRSGLATLAVLTITAIWGSTFFIIKDAVDRMEPIDFLAIRFTIAAALIALVLWPRLRRLPAGGWRAGLGLGVLYGLAQIAQTYGLKHTSASVSGFITGTYVVLTPIILWLFLKVRLSAQAWVAVALACLGLGVLTLTGPAAMGWGEWLTLLGAFFYALHIVVLERFAPQWDALALTAVQLAGVALTCLVAAVPGGVHLSADPVAWRAIAYTVLVAGIATMLLQTWAQRHLSATRTALMMTFEPVFASLFAIALGGEHLSARLLIGGGVILAATVLGARSTPQTPVATATQAAVTSHNVTVD